MKNGGLTFHDLALGETFEFDHESFAFHRDLAHGPWVKTAPRKYTYHAHLSRRTKTDYLVGTSKARVRRGESCGGDRWE